MTDAPKVAGMAEVDDQPIRPASSIVLGRDGAAGLELFMLERTSAAVFAGGMHVFPGGRVDDSDHAPEYAGLCVGPSPAQAAQFAAIGEDALGYWVAAIRECFEEAGFLLAYAQDGRLVDLGGPAEQSRFGAYRVALHDGTLSLSELCRREGLRLAIDHMHFFHAWITPPGRPRRFDTRFFLAEVPAAQEGVHDDMETVSSHWISPQAAIARNDAGSFGLMGPTRKQLETFARVGSAAALVDLARHATEYPVYRPAVPPAR